LKEEEKDWRRRRRTRVLVRIWRTGVLSVERVARELV